MAEVPRLLALDVDGTLLDSGHRITPVVGAAIHRVRAQGTVVVLASSRPPRALWPILVELELVHPSPFVASQGALTGSYSLDGQLRVLDRHPMPIEQARAAVNAAARWGLTVGWFVGERWLVSGMDARIEREARIVGFGPVVADLTAEPDAPEKLLLLSDGQPDLTLVPDLAGELGLPEGLAAQASTPTHVEITAAGVDKAVALARLCADRGIPPDEVAAMGDGRNDLAMLAFAGTAIVPANAAPDVRDVADLVAPRNDEDAVAWAVGALFG